MDMALKILKILLVSISVISLTNNAAFYIYNMYDRSEDELSKWLPYTLVDTITIMTAIVMTIIYI